MYVWLLHISTPTEDNQKREIAGRKQGKRSPKNVKKKKKKENYSSAAYDPIICFATTDP